VFSGSEDGHLRAYSADNGAVIWDVNTAVSFVTVNGIPAAGGSLDGGGPVIANGMLFVNSGYGRILGRTGNVLLAFSVGGK
jgi:polyvinyl alcohol dehydrogenase (cytochrome)